MALETEFKQIADSFAKDINNTLSNDELKEVYGLFKQVVEEMGNWFLGSSQPKWTDRS